jgi:hypothetical protein
MEQPEERRDWVVKRHLSAEALNEYVARLAIARSQVVAITEPQDGSFTLIFEPNEGQQDHLEAEAGQVAETLDTMFGASVTPVQDPAGEEAERVVTIPVAPPLEPAVAPATEPSPS